MSDVDCDISWTVYGVRHDKFAEENRIIVEEEKEINGYMYGGYEGKHRNKFGSVKGKKTIKRKSDRIKKLK